ncbi:VOC family protein [Actinophytocola oryzae]|uniref:VOC domain-containing protein n=1 Tax=Actinophytocola oryzae TaxID=502181 RepID=A0A4R7VZ64_9PSEU|nr:VOC family protein [Actinophytocola oryzae]TDV54849.1 hypothetical protein CLV71_10389 [Actinophytocola oryzae]
MVVEAGAVTEALPAGAPCWVELATNDENRVAAFYAALLGWEYRVTVESAVATGRYVVATRDGFSVAGMYPTEGPSGWVPHITVSDTVSGAERVRQLGGDVTAGPIELAREDSLVYALDPAGAPLVLRTPPVGWLFTTDDVGAYTSADLRTHDGPGADEFYRRLFGYGSEQLGDGAEIDYAEWSLDGRPVLYRYVMGPEYPKDTPAHWLIYFIADPAEGTDATAVRALSLGGGIVVEPHDTRLGRVAVLSDPCGAIFAVIDHLDSPENRRAAVEDPDDD